MWGSARGFVAAVAGAALLMQPVGAWAQEEDRPRPRDVGISVGVFNPGTHNAITDVPGVLVGHATRHEGDTIHTGVTAILPHDGNIYRERVPAAYCDDVAAVGRGRQHPGVRKQAEHPLE